MSGRLTLLISAIIFLTLGFCFADVPPLINFQGKLTDTLGFSVLDSSYSLTFAIWTDSTSGDSVWSETQTVVVKGGLFNVLLGAVAPIPDSVFSSPNRWLGVRKGLNQEVIPRQRFVSVAYAMKAQKADTSKFAETVISDGLWSTDGSNVYRINGNIGIGTANVFGRLTVVHGNNNPEGQTVSAYRDGIFILNSTAGGALFRTEHTTGSFYDGDFIILPKNWTEG